MGDRITSREQLTLVGLGLRTNGAADREKLAALWHSFVEGKVQRRIANQVHATAIYAVYYDYAADHKGECSYLLGAAVRNGTPAPEGMLRIVLPAAKYLVCEAATPADVTPTWERIGAAGLHRTWAGDLEVYNLNRGIEIYVAVE